jgi:hypothetical protein
MKVGTYVRTKHPRPQSCRHGVVKRIEGKKAWVRLHGQVRDREFDTKELEVRS